jgi:AraC-like DNA-binding protein
VSLAQGLLGGGAAFKRLSDELGYASPAAFTRMFTQLVGELPRAWLKHGCGVHDEHRRTKQKALADDQGLFSRGVVETRRIELPTFALRTRRSPS